MLLLSNQGLVKPGLERLCERYRTKAAGLGRDLLAYQEQHAAAVDAANDKNDENLHLEQQVQSWVKFEWFRGEREERSRGG